MYEIIRFDSVEEEAVSYFVTDLWARFKKAPVTYTAQRRDEREESQAREGEWERQYAEA